MAFQPLRFFLRKNLQRAGIHSVVDATRIQQVLDMVLHKEWSEEQLTHIHPGIFKHGVIEVRVDAPALAQELRIREQHILKAVREQLPQHTIKQLRVRIVTQSST